MEQKILVTYASNYGSTMEIAEKISITLREIGLDVDLQQLRKVTSLEEFTAVVIGAPLFMFHWHKDAFRFLNKFRKEIENGLPVAIFAGGPTGKGDEEEWQEIRSQFQREIAKLPWLKPTSVHLVGGKFDPYNLRFPWSWIPALKQMPAVDFRDWTAIQAWARSLPAVFQPETAEVVT